jgi:DNA mismatch repair protein MutS
MMRQYLAIKAEHPDAILFYRMGDFYEMFLEDAELAAPILEIALTTRDKGKPDAVPMCGVPVHSADGYLKLLAERGHRVAICEQVEDPRTLSGRRLVRREVVEVVTPGLVGDPSSLEGLREIRVVALAPGSAHGGAGLASLDASTGDFRATGAETAGELLPELLMEELRRLAPREILLPAGAKEILDGQLAKCVPGAALSWLPEASFDPTGAPVAPDGFEPESSDPGTRAAAALLAYLCANQPFALEQAPRLRHYRLSETMVLDAATRTHLELFESSLDRSRRGTLVECLDLTRTAPGARRLARWIAYPLLGLDDIALRQDAVEYLAQRDRARARLRDALRAVRDLERILAKAVRPTAVPRDLGLLRSSLRALPAVCESLAGGEPASSEWLGGEKSLPPALMLPEPLPDLAKLLSDGLVDDPPVVARGSRGASETGYIREGFRSELDALRESAAKGREWIAGLQAEERERTGIPSLKVRYHPVHGYALEVTKTQLARVPDHYQRKQTLASVERFTTEELREVESRVMGANERAAALEREIFQSLRRSVVGEAARIRLSAGAVADLDALASLAEVARRDGWVRPQVEAGESLEIRGGRHPVVEAVLRNQGSDAFVPNDTDLDPAARQILLLTGPNMSGKSTYLRQVALIVLLAQMGSFVPAESARIGTVDRIFTRVGASDRLAQGESTFMVEMRETAEILRQASPLSLVILDEIGRGTSTYDGLAIAWAVAEYLHDTPGLRARTLFATHYHELTDLARTKERVHNAHFEAREWRDEVVFLRRLVPGGANRSYGIQVARLAGLPGGVIGRARQILANLEGGELDSRGLPRLAGGPAETQTGGGQLPLFGGHGQRELGAEELQVLTELRELDPDHLTPMEALSALQRWALRLRGEDDTT